MSINIVTSPKVPVKVRMASLNPGDIAIDLDNRHIMVTDEDTYVFLDTGSQFDVDNGLVEVIESVTITKEK